MGKGLTVRTIETVKPAASRREIPDGFLSGLYLIVQPTGAKSWAVRYRFAGKPQKHTIGSYPAIDLSSARELARKALVAVAEGRDPAGERRTAKLGIHSADQDLIEKLAAQFLERHAKANTRASTWRETQRLFEKDIVPAWRRRPVREITRRDVIDLLDGVVDRGAPIVANRVLATVRRFFRWCVERGIVAVSPCVGVTAPSTERSRDRVLSDDEIRLLWKGAAKIGWPFGPFVQLLLLTGQRRDEVAGMRWSEFDISNRRWVIPRERAKNDTVHEVPLSDATLAVLSGLPRIANKPEFLFTTNGRNPVAGFSRAKDRLDLAIRQMRGQALQNGEQQAEPLPHWTFHDLRRTAASGMARLGVNLPVIEKVLNHTSGSFAGIVGVYQRHSFSDEKRAALEIWGRFVHRLISDEVADNRP